MGQLDDILKHQNMVRNNIMKSFGVENSEDSLEKGFEDEINPFEMEAYKSELTKAELDEFEKAKHQDGDMHPNGKWVWRQSANGGKGDWRVAKPSRGGGSSKTTSSSSSSDSKTTKVPAIKHQVDNFMYTIQTVNSKFTDESKVTVVKTDKGNWDTYYDGKRVGIVNSSVLSEKVAKEKGWLKEDGRNNEKTTSSASNEEKFADMDIKEAKKKLVGKNLTFKDYWSDGKGGSVDATGKITNVRLYGKNKQPVASVEFENGDSATVSLKQIDEGKAAGYDLSLSDGSKSQQKQDTNNEVSVKDVKAIETFPDLDDEDKYLKRGNKVLKEYTLSVNINGKKIEGTTHEFWASDNLSNTSVGGFETTVYIGSGFPLDKHVKTLEEAKSLFLSTVKKKLESKTYASDSADAYDKGDGKIGNYPVPTKNVSLSGKTLYSKLNNNRHFGFKNGMPSKEIMEKLKNYSGNVKYSYHNNAGTNEIYRIEFM